MWKGVRGSDISLLEYLSKILDVTILALLHGEDINKKEEENQIIVTLLNKNSKKLRNGKQLP